MESKGVLLKAPSISRKNPELFPAGQASSQPKPQAADEWPFLWIS